MVKKILAIVFGCLAVLLVMTLIIVVIYASQAFFGRTITLVLCGCVGALMLFVVYIMITNIVDAVRRRRFDEGALSEKSIEKILEGESARQRRAAQNMAAKQKKQQAANEKKAAKKAEEDARAVRKQTEYEAKKAAEAAARRQKMEEDKARKVNEAKAKAQHISAAEEAARQRAEEGASEEEKALALAEAEALRRAAEEAQHKLEEEENERQRALREAEETQQQEEEAAAARRAQAVASARKQAEAAATARRRAAQTAALSHTQAFAPPETGTVPAFNTQIIEKTADIASAEAQQPAKVPLSKPLEPTPGLGESIWDKMQVRQSAAPVLAQRDAAGPVAETVGDTAAAPTQNLDVPEVFSPEAAQADGEDVSTAETASKWTYKPAKLPDAWKTQSKMPGDMSYVSTLSMPAVEGEKARTEETKPAEPKAEAAKTETTKTAKAAQAGDAEQPVKRPRGRPPKPKDPEEENKPKRPRGRPPKPKDPEEENKPKRPRGRPPKPKDPEEENKPKRPRGRPRKNPLPEEAAGGGEKAEPNT